MRLRLLIHKTAYLFMFKGEGPLEWRSWKWIRTNTLQTRQSCRNNYKLSVC